MSPGRVSPGRVSRGRASLALTGNTPLAPIRHGIPGVEVYAKLEYFNPTGSVKDRAVKGMIEQALADDLLAGRTLIEATSGNTGIALAAIGAALQLAVHIFMPANASPERKRLLATLGAVVTYTDPLEGTDGAQAEARRRVAAEPERYYYPDQYANPANWQAHYRGTGPEIWEQSRGRVTHFVAGLGTSGTFVGTSRFLRGKGVRCTAVQPDTPLHGLEGWKHMRTVAHVPADLRRRALRRPDRGPHAGGVPPRGGGRTLPGLPAQPVVGRQPGGRVAHRARGGPGGGRGDGVPGQLAQVPGRRLLGPA